MNKEEIFVLKAYEKGTHSYSWQSSVHLLILKGKGMIIRSDGSKYCFSNGDLFAVFRDESIKIVAQSFVLVGSVKLSDRKEYRTELLHYASNTTELYKRAFLFRLTIESENIAAKNYILGDVKSILYSLLLDIGTQKYPVKNEDMIDILVYSCENLSNPEYNINEEIRRRNYSQSYMRKLIFEETGQTPNHFMKLIRIERAKELFRSSHYTISINDAAKQSGFKDALYFAREFKKIEGISPSEYIKKNQKTANNKYFVN